MIQFLHQLHQNEILHLSFWPYPSQLSSHRDRDESQASAPRGGQRHREGWVNFQKSQKISSESLPPLASENCEKFSWRLTRSSLRDSTLHSSVSNSVLKTDNRPPVFSEERVSEKTDNRVGNTDSQRMRMKTERKVGFGAFYHQNRLSCRFWDGFVGKRADCFTRRFWFEFVIIPLRTDHVIR